MLCGFLSSQLPANCDHSDHSPDLDRAFFCVVLVFVLLVACVLPKTSMFFPFQSKVPVTASTIRHLEG